MRLENDLINEVPLFDMRVSKHFNSMIEDLELIELSMKGKIFT